MIWNILTLVACAVIAWPRLPWRRRRVLHRLRLALPTSQGWIHGGELSDYVTLSLLEDDGLIERRVEDDGRHMFAITERGISRFHRRWWV